MFACGGLGLTLPNNAMPASFACKGQCIQVILNLVSLIVLTCAGLWLRSSMTTALEGLHGHLLGHGESGYGKHRRGKQGYGTIAWGSLQQVRVLQAYKKTLHMTSTHKDRAVHTSWHSLVHLPATVCQVPGYIHVQICLGTIDSAVSHTQSQIPRQEAGQVFKPRHKHGVLLNEPDIQHTSNAHIHKFSHHLIYAVFPHSPVHVILHCMPSLPGVRFCQSTAKLAR